MGDLEMEGGCHKKLIKSKSGLRIVVTNDEYRSPFLLCEPQWIPDSESTSCTECRAKFDFLTRRHHCRRCGQIYCGSCCHTKMGLPRMCFVDPVRVCNRCALVTNKESNFFDRQLKTLTSGATFILDQRLSPGSDGSDGSDSVNYLVCNLSQDHRYLVFEDKAADSVTSVDLYQVKTLGVARDPDAADIHEELEGTSSVEIVYAEKGKEQYEQRVKLCSGPEPHRKLANAWIDAIQQAGGDPYFQKPCSTVVPWTRV